MGRAEIHRASAEGSFYAGGSGRCRPNGFIRVLARNVPPNLRCFCGEPAITVCTACSDLDMHYLCDDCARFHDCGWEYQLPVVNSPRLGICKYMGDSADAAEFRSYLEKSEDQEKNRIDDFLQSGGRSPVFRKSILEEKAPKNSG